MAQENPQHPYDIYWQGIECAHAAATDLLWHVTSAINRKGYLHANMTPQEQEIARQFMAGYKAEIINTLDLYLMGQGVL